MGDVVQFPVPSVKVTPSTKTNSLVISSTNHAIMTIDGEYKYMTLFGKSGKPIAKIALQDGTVEITEPGQVPEAATQFWAAVAFACPMKK
ncbi:MAG: hypothetical protein ACREQ5_03485 [Candidatus Dormibacteria bacterium]